MVDLLNTFKLGPLSNYRKLATFDWKKLRVLLETEDIIRYKHEIVQFLKRNPMCHSTNAETFKEMRHIAQQRVRWLSSCEQLKYENMIDNPMKLWAAYETLVQWEPGALIRMELSRSMFPNVVRSLGTDIHDDLLAQAIDEKIVGCFALTEIAHGSNVGGMQTRAVYDNEKKGFILHCPSFEAAKCWSGVLGESATHAIVYAQLFTADGHHHGLQQFVVKVREPDTNLSPDGVTILDMGPKIGLNSIDNGMVMFDNYFVPKSALLNRNGDVNDKGEYVSRLKDKGKEKGAALASLSNGRIIITNIASSLLAKSVTIAVRYAAVRTQFGPPGCSEEVPLLEYQTHQHRLLPHLAGAVVLKVFSRFIVTQNFQNALDKHLGIVKADADERRIELHAISSACKPLAGWFAKEAIQECREACAAHGYLASAQFGNIRNDNDANMTYEGENHVLIQQTSNWLLRFAPLAFEKQTITAPYGSIDFLTHFHEILSMKNTAASYSAMVEQNRKRFYQMRNVSTMNVLSDVLEMYQWLVCFLLKISKAKYEKSISMGKDAFWAKNDNQVFYSRNLAVAYIQHFVLYRFNAFMNETEDPALRAVLGKIFALFGLFNLERHIAHLYQGGYFFGEKPSVLLQDSILILCQELKNEAVSIVDAIAPDDFILNSILGHSDGQVYEHLKNSIYQSKGSSEKLKHSPENNRNPVNSKL